MYLNIKLMDAKETASLRTAVADMMAIVQSWSGGLSALAGFNSKVVACGGAQFGGQLVWVRMTVWAYQGMALCGWDNKLVSLAPSLLA